MSVSRFRRKRDRLIRYFQTGLLALGIAMLSIYALAQVHTQIGRAQALSTFDEAQGNSQSHAEPSMVARNDAAKKVMLDIERPDQSLWGQSRISAYNDASETSGDGPAGVLSIPVIDLRVPIFPGAGELALNRGVGRIPGTARIGEGGNLGLAGHRDGFFRGLKDIEIGDVIYVQSLNASTRYKVSEISIVLPEDTYVLFPTEQSTLTLVTCYPFYFIGSAPKRYIVKGVEIPPASPSGVDESANYQP